MNSWQTFLASIRLSLPEISSFQRNINFYLKYPDIRSSHARISRSRLVTIDLSQARAPRALPTAQSPLFFSPFFAIAPHAFMGREKNVGRVDDWGHSKGPISFHVSVDNKDRRFEDRNRSSLVEFLSYTRTLFRSLNEIFSRLEVWNRTIHVIHVR